MRKGTSVTVEDINQVPEKIKAIYLIVSELESMFHRHFTPDGHMVGSIGEILAAYHYDLELYPESTEIHDAKSKNGLEVQVKTTQINKIGLSSNPEHLIVLSINKDGSNLEIYNGPGDIVWNKAGKVQKNGQRYISVSTLKKLMDDVPDDKKIERKNEGSEAAQAELEREEKKWEQTYNANRDDFRAMARQALADLDAGETLEMVIAGGKVKAR